MLTEAHKRLQESGIGGVLLSSSIAIANDNKRAAQAILDECGLPAHVSRIEFNEITYIKPTL